jgi:hypothetical protein
MNNLKPYEAILDNQLPSSLEGTTEPNRAILDDKLPQTETNKQPYEAIIGKEPDINYIKEKKSLTSYFQEGWQEEKQKKEITNQEVATNLSDFLTGVTNQFQKDLNMIPGVNMPVKDINSLSYKTGEAISEFGTLLIPVAGAEKAIATGTSWAVKGLMADKTIYEAVSSEFSKTLLMKGSRAMLGGALFGLEEAYYKERNNEQADYEKNIKLGASLGLVGETTIHSFQNYIAPYIANNFKTFWEDLSRVEKGGDFNQDAKIVDNIPQYNEEIKPNQTMPIPEQQKLTREYIQSEDFLGKFHNTVRNDIQSITNGLTENKPEITEEEINNIKDEVLNNKKYAKYSPEKLDETAQKIIDNKIKIITAENNKIEQRNMDIMQNLSDHYSSMNKAYQTIENAYGSFTGDIPKSNISNAKDYWNASVLTYRNELSKFWDMAKKKHGLGNKVEQVLNNKHFEEDIRVLVKELSTNATQSQLEEGLRKQLLPYAQTIHDFMNNALQTYQKAGIELKNLSGYVGSLQHNMNAIRDFSNQFGKEEWEKLGVKKEWYDYITSSDNLEVPFTKDEITDFIASKTQSKNTASDFWREFANYSRRFKFTTPQAEFIYKEQFGNASTLMQNVYHTLDLCAFKAGTSAVFGELPEMTIDKIGKMIQDPDGAKLLSNILFPENIGFEKVPATIITALNTVGSISRLTGSLLNPLKQMGRYFLEDQANITLNVMRKSSILDGLKRIIPSNTPEFVKEMTQLSSFEKKSLKTLLQEFKTANQLAVNSAHDFLTPKTGFIANLGKLAEGINSKVNGSHINDTYTRKSAGNAYAIILKNLAKDGQLTKEIPNIPDNIVKKFTDTKGFINPIPHLQSSDYETSKWAERVANKYYDFIEAVNPIYTKSNAPVSIGSVGSLINVRMSRWITTVAQKTQLPLLTEFAKSNGMARVGAGMKLVTYASMMTGIEQAVLYLDAQLSNTKYDPKFKDIATSFATYGTLGSLYFSFKFGIMPLVQLGKAGIYGLEGAMADKYSEEEFDKYSKSKESLKKATYMFRYAQSLIDRFD